ncbi:hypothetical protein BC834DRAFT_546456 [Gloeopeniophorella convolvens]|nr:hypothetical protein BC834DRAFT_546456 [Gloeopeniophorella convolvens]
MQPQLAPNASTEYNPRPAYTHEQTLVGSVITAPQHHQPSTSHPCRVPTCNLLALYDTQIQEHRDYCEEHLRHVVARGFAAACSLCKTMPARAGTAFCSRACANRSAGEQHAVPDGFSRSCAECRLPLGEKDRHRLCTNCEAYHAHRGRP